MGCGASKGGEEINSNMKRVGVPAFDEFFDSASGMLQTLEDLRETFQETREEMLELSRAEELKEVSLIEAIRVFFWSCSAHKNGTIVLAGLKFDSSTPSFTVECGDMDWRTWDFADNLRKLIGGFLGAPKTIQEVGEKIKEITEKLKEVSTDVTGKIKGAGLEGMEAIKAVGNATSNIATVTNGLSKAPKVLEQAQAALKDLQALIPKLGELIEKADEVGAQAHKKGLTRMSEIFDEYQKAPKKTKEELKAYHKEQKRRAKGKKPKKNSHAPGAGAGAGAKGHGAEKKAHA